jgi:hypothetical protein
MKSARPASETLQNGSTITVDSEVGDFTEFTCGRRNASMGWREESDQYQHSSGDDVNFADPCMPMSDTRRHRRGDRNRTQFCCGA